MTSLRAPFRRHAAAFTLTEMMVSLALTVALGVLLLSFFGGVLRVWNTTSSRTESFGEARAALHLLDHELDLAIPGVTEGDGTVSGAVTTSLNVADGKPDEAIGFLCKVAPPLQPDGENASDVCGVIYFLSPTLDAGGNPVPGTPTCLYRRLIDSKTTCGDLQSGLPFSDQTSPASPSTEVVARNVIGFDVVLRDASLQPISGTASPLPVPTEVDVTIRVLGSQAAQTYFQAAAGNVGDGLRQRIEAQDVREFTMRHRL